MIDLEHLHTLISRSMFMHIIMIVHMHSIYKLYACVSLMITSCMRHGVRSEVRWQHVVHLFNHHFRFDFIVLMNGPSGVAGLNSGLSKEDEEHQVSTLLYCLGEDADDVRTSTNISDKNRKKYTEVLAKFDGHFKVRKNVILEFARFNRRVQDDDDDVEQFITSLYSLSEDCQYAELKEEMIRDRIVVGIRDTGLSEILQMD